MIYRAIKYLYYRIYVWNLGMWGESDLPHLNAILGVSFLMFLNLLTLFFTVKPLIDCQPCLTSSADEYIMGGVFLILVLVNYLLLVRDGKYVKIAEEFKKESPAQKRKGIIFVWFYIIGSFILYPLTILAIKNLISLN